MTDSVKWPNPDRPGVPMFPGRDGLHAVVGPHDIVPVLVLWRSQTNDYLKGEIHFTPEEVMDARIAYCGPCLTPAQISEMLAGERKRCLDACKAVSENAKNTVSAANALRLSHLVVSRVKARADAADDCWKGISRLGDGEC